jgi:hypothetical protein
MGSLRRRLDKMAAPGLQPSQPRRSRPLIVLHESIKVALRGLT